MFSIIHALLSVGEVWVDEYGGALVVQPKEQAEELFSVRISKRMAAKLRWLDAGRSSQGTKRMRAASQAMHRYYPNTRSDGWCKVSVLADQLNTTPEVVICIAERNSKRRYQLCKIDVVVHIRCLQGHSGLWAKLMGPERLQVWIESVWQEVGWSVLSCVHGTTWKALLCIRASGYLSAMERAYVHFASHERVISGMANDATVLIYLDVRRWLWNGHKIYSTPNGVLHPVQKDGSTTIPLEYIWKIRDRVSGDSIPIRETASSTEDYGWPDPQQVLERAVACTDE